MGRTLTSPRPTSTRTSTTWPGSLTNTPDCAASRPPPSQVRVPASPNTRKHSYACACSRLTPAKTSRQRLGNEGRTVLHTEALHALDSFVVPTCRWCRRQADVAARHCGSRQGRRPRRRHRHPGVPDPLPEAQGGGHVLPHPGRCGGGRGVWRVGTWYPKFAGCVPR